MNTDTDRYAKPAAPVDMPEPVMAQVRFKPENDTTWSRWKVCAVEDAREIEAYTLVNGWGYEVRYLHAEHQVRALLAGVSAPAAQAINLLAADHSGMKVDYRGLFSQVQRAIKRSDPGYAEILRQLEGHLQELGQRWYAGDTNVVDEILQLYCIERDSRKTVRQDAAAAPRAQADELEAITDMLETARTELEMLRKALSVAVEPHQTLADRMIEAAIAAAKENK